MTIQTTVSTIKLAKAVRIMSLLSVKNCFVLLFFFFVSTVKVCIDYSLYNASLMSFSLVLTSQYCTTTTSKITLQLADKTHKLFDKMQTVWGLRQWGGGNFKKGLRENLTKIWDLRYEIWDFRANERKKWQDGQSYKIIMFITRDIFHEKH